MPEEPKTLPEMGTPAFKRLEDGYFIGNGACNPGAILRTMVRHLDADRDLGWKPLCCDPGMRQMLFQLNYLFQVESGKTLDETFSEDWDQCANAYELTKKEN